MKVTKKVISIVVCVFMLMQLLSVAGFANSATAEVTTPYVHRLSDTIAGAGEEVTYANVDYSITDSGALFSLVYNSDHYDEDWVEREKAVISFENMSTGEVVDVVQETYPLKCIEMDHWEDEIYVSGRYDIKFTVPTTLQKGYYHTTIKLYVPRGKESDARAKQTNFYIDRLRVIDNTPSVPGGGSAALDKTVVSEKYYDAAKVCYDLGLIPDIYEKYNKNITKEDLVYALVELAGLKSSAEKLKTEKSLFADVSKDTYLNGCVNLLTSMSVLSGDSYNTFGVKTEMSYYQIIKCIMDLLGYAPRASAMAGYPTGYLICATQANVTKNISKGDTAVTGEELAQLIYNALEAKPMVVKQYTMDGPVYEISDESLLYQNGYYKYIGNAVVSGRKLTISGKEYNEDALYGSEVSNKELTIADNDVKGYPDAGMKLYVKNGQVLSGLKYYHISFGINVGYDTKNVTIDIGDAIGYTKYKVDDGEYKFISDAKNYTYSLSQGCGEKVIHIIFANDSGTVTQEYTKDVTITSYHKITYMVDGVEFDSEKVVCGGKIPALTRIPEKDGWTFEKWEGLPENMPDGDISVTAVFTKDVTEPEVDIFEATLPSQNGVAGETLTIENIQDIIPKNMVAGLNYASTIYDKYIEDDAVFTFENSADTVEFTCSNTPLIAEDYKTFHLEIPVPSDIKNGTYKVTIMLDIAYEKEARDVKPYKFTIDQFVVTGGIDDGGNDDGNGDGTEDDDEITETDVIFNIADTTNLAPVAGAEVTIADVDGEVVKKIVSDSDGRASVAIADGTYTVQIMASGYEVRTFTIEKTKEQYEFSPYLNKNPLVKVETSVKEMTKQEMIDAGIDINAADNKHVYKCVTVLKFIPVTEGGSVDITPIEIDFDYVYDETGTIIQAKPAYCDGMVIYPVAKDIYLIIHSEVTWLKEIFDVQLVVANTSVIETIKDCKINLNLPEGLSLATMTGEQQSLTVEIAEIAPLATNDIHWYVRGDEKGEYLINGNIVGIREGGGIKEDIKASFTMQEPITVLAGDAMKLLIEAEKYATPGTPYKVRYTLQNVSSKTLYDVVLNVLGGKFCKAYSVEELIHNGELVDLDGLTGTFNDGYELKAEEFASGDVLSGVFEITFGQGIETGHTRYMVSEMFTFTGEGSTTTIPTEIVLVDSVDNHKLDEGEVRTEPTCVSEGKKVYTCQICSEEEEVTLPKKDHELGDWIISKESNCVTKGEKYKKCAHCDYKVTAELLEGEHKFDDGVVTVPPTETAEGIRTHTCINCTATKQTKVPKLEKQDLYFIIGDTMNRVYNGCGEEIYNKADNDSENGGTITYTSSNEAVAKVDNNGKLTILKVGQATITATAAATEKYALTSASYVLTVTKAPLSITAKDVYIKYGEEFIPGGYNVSGLRGADSQDVLLGEVEYEYTYEPFASVGEYSVSIGGLTSENYEITFVDGKIIVSKAVDYEISLSNLTQRFGNVTPVEASVSPADETAVTLVEYQNAEGVWSEELPQTVGKYQVRASLVSAENIAVQEGKYTSAELEIKAGAMISGAEGNIGVDIIEGEKELEYIIPDSVVDEIMNNIPQTGEVVIDSTGTGNVINNLVLPANIIKAFDQSEDVETFTVIAEASEISMDKDVLATLGESMTLTDKLRINVEVVDADSLTEQQQAAVDAISTNATVLQLNLDILRHDDAGNVVETESVHQLNGNVDIRTAYTLPGEMAGKRIVVCYVSSDGSTTYMRAEYNDGFVCFATDHFSHYVLAVIDCTHEWNSGEIVVTPTTTSTGLKKYTCNLCGETKEETLPKVTPQYSGGGGAAVTSKFTVKFETNGGSAVKSAEVKQKEKLTKPEDPSKEGYTFAGWYTDTKLTKEYNFSETVTKSFTLYAKWTEAEKEPEKAVTFTDVKETDWFYENVKYVVDNKLMNGVDEDKFAPGDTLTRAMLVTVLYRNAGEPATNKSIPFADVDMGAYYTNAVSWAKQNGIVNGVTESEFAPNSNITREQIAAIMHRYAQYMGYDVSVGENTNILSYTDAEDIAEYATASMQYVVGSGLIKGKSETTLNPKDNATRAEIAAILQRFIEGNK